MNALSPMAAWSMQLAQTCKGRTIAHANPDMWAMDGPAVMVGFKAVLCHMQATCAAACASPSTK